MLQKILFYAVIVIAVIFCLIYFKKQKVIVRHYITQENNYKIGKEVAYQGVEMYLIKHGIVINVDSMRLSIDSVEKDFILQDYEN